MEQLQACSDKSKHLERAYLNGHNQLNHVVNQFNAMVDAYNILRKEHESLLKSTPGDKDLENLIKRQNEELNHYKQLTPRIQYDLEASRRQCFELEAQNFTLAQENCDLTAEVVEVKQQLEQEREEHRQTRATIAVSRLSSDLKRDIGELETEDPPKKRAKARKLRVKV